MVMYYNVYFIGVQSQTVAESGVLFVQVVLFQDNFLVSNLRLQEFE